MLVDFPIQNTVKKLETEIYDLQSEKENLTSALDDAKTNSAANK
jgi:predicted DNA-binding ribbon-helix-helix protein